MMFTDPDHLRVSDPGKVEGNVVFTYLDTFDPDKDAVADLKARYRAGGLGDMVVKKRLEGILQELLKPIRNRREEFARDPGFVFDILMAGTVRADAITRDTLSEVRDGLGVFSFPAQRRSRCTA